MVPTDLSVGAARIGAAALPADVWLDPFDKRAARRMVADVPCSAPSSLAGAPRGSAGQVLCGALRLGPLRRHPSENGSSAATGEGPLPRRFRFEDAACQVLRCGSHDPKVPRA